MAAKAPTFALDTNFLLDLANDDNLCKECLEVLQERSIRPTLFVTPTVLAELAHFAGDDGAGQQEAAQTALDCLKGWGCKPINFTDVVMVKIAAEKILAANLIPPDERNDARIIAEASHAKADFLLTSDSDITGINANELTYVLRDCHFAEICIIWPQKVVKAFK